MSHTTGPWRVKASSGCLHVVSDDQMFQTGCISFDGAGEANARLIAAAPDLLTALKHVAETMRVADWPNEPALWALYQSSPEMQEIHAAIKKAEGQS